MSYGNGYGSRGGGGGGGGFSNGYDRNGGGGGGGGYGYVAYLLLPLCFTIRRLMGSTSP